MPVRLPNHGLKAIGASLKRDYDTALLREINIANKRPKREHCKVKELEEDDTTVEPFVIRSDSVALNVRRHTVAYLSLSTLKAFAPHIFAKIALKTKLGRYKLYTWQPTLYVSKKGMQRWASWLRYRDIRVAMDGDSASFSVIHDTLGVARAVTDDDFKDALVDYIYGRIFYDENTLEEVKTSVIRRGLRGFMKDATIPSSEFKLEQLIKDLILHYDPEGAMARDIYPTTINTSVSHLILTYWTNKGEGDLPKDPSYLRDKEWCKLYHIHSSKKLPCYRTMKI